jgi:hypothetical protein
MLSQYPIKLFETLFVSNAQSPRCSLGTAHGASGNPSCSLPANGCVGSGHVTAMSQKSTLREHSLRDADTANDSAQTHETRQTPRAPRSKRLERIPEVETLIYPGRPVTRRRLTLRPPRLPNDPGILAMHRCMLLSDAVLKASAWLWEAVWL